MVLLMVGELREGWRAGASMRASLPAPEVAGGPESSPSRVLVAEDNPVNQKVAVAMLAKLGYQADAVANGIEAVRALSRIPYAAVLMDCQMPEMDGYQATAEIRKQEGASRNVPIIALTAKAIEGEAEKCLAAGMDDYLSKPVDVHLLDALLRRWVGRDGNALATATSDDGTKASGAVLDRNKLAELRSLEVGPGQTAFSEWTAMFLEDTPPRLALLGDAVDRGDTRIVEQIAHYILGASAHVGATGIAALCSQIQALGRSGDFGPASKAVDELLAEYERFRAAVDEELKHEEIS